MQESDYDAGLWILTCLKRGKRTSKINSQQKMVESQIDGPTGSKGVNWKDTKWWSEMEYMELKYEWVTVNGNDKVYKKTIRLSGQGGVEKWFIGREVPRT